MVSEAIPGEVSKQRARGLFLLLSFSGGAGGFVHSSVSAQQP